MLDGDLADLPAIGLVAADRDLDAAERNRIRRLGDQLAHVVDDAVSCRRPSRWWRCRPAIGPTLLGNLLTGRNGDTGLPELLK